MPIYEYECTNCGHNLEHLQRISDNPLEKCPECGQASLRRLISMPGFRLKGTGWYATDFKDSGKPKKENPKDQSESKADTAKSDSTKPTSKTKSDKPTTDSTSSSTTK